MTDITLPRPPFRIDRVWAAIAAIALIVLALDTEAAPAIGADWIGALIHTLPFIVFAVLAVAFLKATGAEGLIARAFEGRETRMIVLAAVFGGLSPFCSCEVIPFIAALLAMGAPLSAVMAFWLASPLMDPAMFLITSAALGPEIAVAKTVAAVVIGLSGGFAVKALAPTGLFADPLKTTAPKTCGSCCGASGPASPFEGRPVWRFWQSAERRAAFGETARENALFLLKWLTLAYLVEALMLAYVPADLVAGLVGGDGPGAVLMGALVGGPAYLNGYAAPALVDGLIAQGMSQGAAMAFLIAGGVSCIPAALAVWALVKPHVFATYLGIAFAGSLAAGLLWGAMA